MGDEIAMAVKIDRIQPAGVNVRMQQGKPAYSHVVTVTGPAKMIYIAGPGSGYAARRRSVSPRLWRQRRGRFATRNQRTPKS